MSLGCPEDDGCEDLHCNMAIIARDGDFTMRIHPLYKLQMLYKGKAFWTCVGHPAPSKAFRDLFDFLKYMTVD